MIRRLKNWAREVEWLAVVAVILWVLAAIVAVFSLWHVILWVLAVVLTGIGIGIAILSLRN